MEMIKAASVDDRVATSKYGAKSVKLITCMAVMTIARVVISGSTLVGR